MPASDYGVGLYREQGTGILTEKAGGIMIRRGVQTLAATGTVQGDAAAITSHHVAVTGADAAKGVILPVAQGGEEVFVNNTAAAILKVYPQTGGSVGAGGANAAYSQAASKSALFKARSATVWDVLLSA